LRIAQVTAHTNPFAPPGGRETGGMNVYVAELSRELARLGVAVDVFVRRDGDLPHVDELGPGLRIIRLDAGPAEVLDKETTLTTLPAFARAGVRFMESADVRYDLVHSHYWQGAWAGTIFAARARVPHAVLFHTLGEVKNRARSTEEETAQRIYHERQAIRRADAILTTSSHEGGFLERYYSAERERIHTVPCGVDLGLFQPRDREACRRTLGLPANTPVLLWVGRLEKLKGVDILVDALAQLEVPDALLLIAGGDERAEVLKAELMAQAARAGVARQVRFVGSVPHHQLPDYYSAADVVVVPSYYESFGLVAVEAMACGTPVVASRVGGLVSTVEDGVTGFLIPWRCPEPFAEKIEVLLRNPELRSRFGASAQRSVERFGWSRVATEVAGFYEHVRTSHWARRHGNEGAGPFGAEAFESAILAAG
jgi:D-inositol-3-phosphate glycosyltransferase